MPYSRAQLRLTRPAMRAQVAALQAKLAAENGLPGHEVMVTAGAAACAALPRDAAYWP